VSVNEAFFKLLGNLEVFAKTNKKVDIPIETHNEKILFGCHNKFKYFDYIFLSFQNLKKGKIQKKL
jgi:hypothetical protein